MENTDTSTAVIAQASFTNPTNLYSQVLKVIFDKALVLHSEILHEYIA